MRQSNNSWIEGCRLKCNIGQNHVKHHTRHTEDHHEDYQKERICGQEGVVLQVTASSVERHSIDGEPVRFGPFAFRFRAGAKATTSSASRSKRAWRSFSVLLSRRLASALIMARAERSVLSALVSDLVRVGRKRSCVEMVAVMNFRLPFQLQGKKAGREPDLSSSSRRQVPVHPWSPAGDKFLCRLQVLGSVLARLRVAHDFEAELLALDNGVQSRAFHGGNVNEHIRLAVLGSNEAEALGTIEEFYCSCGHDVFLSIGHKNIARHRMCGAHR